MFITDHAALRIKERTKLSPDLVKQMLESGLSCKLGADDYDGSRRKYYLLYSYADNCFFVAALNFNETNVVTVVPNDQVAFRGIRICEFHRRRAKDAWVRSDLAKEIKKTAKTAECILEVYADNTLEFTHNLGFAHEDDLTIMGLVKCFYDDIVVIFEAVNKWYKVSNALKVRFEFRVKRTPLDDFNPEIKINYPKLAKWYLAEKYHRAKMAL